MKPRTLTNIQRALMQALADGATINWDLMEGYSIKLAGFPPKPVDGGLISVLHAAKYLDYSEMLTERGRAALAQDNQQLSRQAIAG
jgi:hypothetical protein